MVVWQYQIIVLESLSKAASTMLTKQGETGWELVTVQNLFAYMKRPILSDTALDQGAKP